MLTQAIYDVLADDATLVSMLASYGGLPGIFTTDPVPGDAPMPYIVSAGAVSDAPFDTKTTLGRDIIRDVRCYAEADGSAVEIEAIAERVRALLHRQPLTIDGYVWVLSAVTGPMVADEQDVYGRIVSVSVIAEQE